MSKASDKLRAIGVAVTAIEKQFGRGAIMPLGADPANAPVYPAYSTGSIGLDLALGVGGIPRGRVIEIFGAESSGKTTLTLHAIAECQKAGGVCAFIDVEHRLDVSYAKHIGVDPQELLVSQPDCGEQALEIANQLVRTGAIDLIVVDSASALRPKAAIEGEMDDAYMGLQARLMSQALRNLTAVCSKFNTTVIFINQLTQKVGMVFANLGESTTGSNALKFYASVRLDIRRVGQIKEGDLCVGTRVRAKVVKNKVAPPFREAEFDILWGTGIDPLGELVDLGIQNGLIEKNGARYMLDGSVVGRDEQWPLGQTRAAARACLAADRPLVDKLRTVLRGQAFKLQEEIK